METKMTKTDELLEGLTEDQQAAVEAEGRGLLRISAGAGSGKTEVLTRRIVSLFKQAIKPDELIAITYTNKAAAEMKVRLVEKQKLEIGKLRKMEISTFHSFLKRFIAEDPFGAGLDRTTEIVASVAQKLLLKDLTEKFAGMFGKDMVSGDEGIGAEAAKKLVEVFGDALSGIRRFIVNPAEFYNLSKRKFAERNRDGQENAALKPVSELERNALEWLYRFYTCYVEELEKRNMMDFDEIFIRSRALLREMREGGTLPRQRVFLIDEFQDNNADQFEIVKEFCKDRDSHICVVGDEKQSIYSFQGADVEAFRNFQADKDIILADNFRSYGEIIGVADAYLEAGGDCGKLFARQTAKRGSSPVKPAVVCMLTEEERDSDIYSQIAKMIHKIVDSKMLIDCRKSGNKRSCCYGDIAVIVGSVNNDIPREFEDDLEGFQIPYVLSGGMGFYGKSEIKEILSFLNLLVYPDDNHSLVKILTGPLYGLKDSDVIKIFNDCKSEKVPMLAHILAKNESEFLNAPELRNAAEFRKLFVELKAKAGKTGILDLCYMILEQAGFNEYAASRESDLKRRRMKNNLTKFLGVVRDFERNGIYTSLRDFLAYVDKILETGDEEEAGLGLEDKDAVKILTIHKSKGLEFPIVICPSVKDRQFKFSKPIHFDRDHGLMVSVSGVSESAILEEIKAAEKFAAQKETRRKYYVAFTRAENNLFIIGKDPSFEPDATVGAETEKKTEKAKSKKDNAKMALKGGTIPDIISVLTENPELGEIIKLKAWPELIDKIMEQTGTESADTALEGKPADSNDLKKLESEIFAITEYLQGMANIQNPEKAGDGDNTFSLQDLYSFNGCPRKYYFTKKHTKSFNERQINVAAVAGTLFHETVRLYHQHEKAGVDEGVTTGLDKAYEILDSLILCYGEEGKSSRQRVMGLVKSYFESELGRQKPWQIEAEVNVKFGVGAASFFLRGFADRVDKSESGEIRIIDFKTRGFSPIAHDSYRNQLALYRIAASRGILGKVGDLNFAKSYIAYVTEEKLELVEIEPDMAEFEEYAIKVANTIRNERIWRPVRSEACRDCGFAVLCNLKTEQIVDQQIS
ncbi:MAG: ATP-dependent DNA helicase PcrA [bacterium ADurb.Bin157]|nr:MAG: ATP-dependent DNA helicase PcrA [bacterium ADurb.Bin157]